MQNSVIDLILSDELHESIKHSGEYKSMSDECFAVYEQLRKQLPAEQFAVFEKFADLTMGAESESNKAYFKEGIKMGMRIAVECLTES